MVKEVNYALLGRGEVKKEKRYEQTIKTAIMRWTKGRLSDKESISWFIPRLFRDTNIEDSDWQKFFDLSERGKEPAEITPGYEAIVEGKRWRGIHVGMYEDGVLDGSVPYFTMLGGENKKELMPRAVVDFLNRCGSY